MSLIYEIFGARPYEMARQLMEAAQVAERIPRGASVALKPNLVVGGAPEEGATTHGEILAGVISYLQEHGVEEISVIEGSWVGEETGRAFRAAGYDRVCDRYHIPFYDLKKDRVRPVDTPIGPIQVCCRALDAGYLINLPVLKGHCQTKMTCALKNGKGCLPDREKRRFHAEGLLRPIAALACALKPNLTLVDSICGDLNFEEGGTPVYTGRMLLGEDPVQIDAYGCRLMGLDPAEVPYIGLAEQWGCGSTRIGPEELVRLNDPSRGGDYPKPTGAVAKLTDRVQEDAACSACYAALVRALYTSGRGRGREIAIGQGWRGKTFCGLGVGTCCSGAEQVVRGCPPTAEEIARALAE
jgi:uncharacterized protein (DUF362 family)